MQEIQNLCVPQNIKKVRNFWKSNMETTKAPTESPKVIKRSCSAENSNENNKKYKPQLYPKPSLPKQVNCDAHLMTLYNGMFLIFGQGGVK